MDFLGPVSISIRKDRYTLATKSTVDTIDNVDFRLCLRFVAVNIVSKVERVQLGRLRLKWVIFVARMSNVLSALSPVCTGSYVQMETAR